MVFETSSILPATLECSHGDARTDGWEIELAARNHRWLTYLAGPRLVHIFCEGPRGALIRTERRRKIIEVVWRPASAGKRQPK